MNYNYCQNCGKKIDTDSEYCKWCGTKCISAKRKYVTFYELESDELAKISKNDSISNKSSDVIKDVTASEVKKTMSDTSIPQKPVIPVSDNDFKIKKTEDGYVLEKYTGKGKNAVVPIGITVIGEKAFYECYSLKSVDLPDSVTSIEKNAFSGCISLTSITIPDKVKSSGNSAFSICISLTNISISEGVRNIGDSAFSGCNSLMSIVIPDGVTSIGKSAFCGCDSLMSIVIPDGVTSIGINAFSECRSLKSVEIPKTVTSIGMIAFGYYMKGKLFVHKIKKVNDFVIRCYKGTAGEKYALRNGFKYELIG